MEIKQFNLSKQNLPYFIAKLENLDFSLGYVADVYLKKTKRTLDQNALYWKFLSEFGSYLGYESEELHDIMRRKFLFKVVMFDGQAEIVLLSTTKQDTKSMSTYMENCLNFAANHGFIFEENYESRRI